jgi:5'-nucleotidase
MRVLLVNDDGIEHFNLKQLEISIKKFASKLMIVAPAEEQSAKSMSMTLGEIKYKQLSENSYKIFGTPVDCVNFAISGLNFNPDIIISGVNEGPNLGSDIMYSGTVGACVQAFKYKIPSIAISKSYNSIEDLVNILTKVFSYVFENRLFSQEYILNINIPDVTNDFKIVFAKPYFFESKAKSIMNSDKFTYNREIISSHVPGSDIFEFRSNNVTISKLKLNYNYE